MFRYLVTTEMLYFQHHFNSHSHVNAKALMDKQLLSIQYTVLSTFCLDFICSTLKLCLISCFQHDEYSVVKNKRHFRHL